MKYCYAEIMGKGLIYLTVDASCDMMYWAPSTDSVENQHCGV